MVIGTDQSSRVPIMLVVGNLRSWARQGRVPPQIDGFHFVGFQDITPDYLADLNPEVILSALMADQFDALDLARKLSDAGFQGRYRAVTVDIPNPRAVMAEVRAVAPGIDFDLYIIDGPTRP